MYSQKISLLKVIYLLSLPIICSACANIVSPQGGIKDVDPPKVVKCTPTDRSTNFQSKEITIFFDEYIQPVTSSNDIIFNPQPRSQPKISTKAKSIKVSFENNLEPNTTYTINFGKSISDYNEGNILKDFSYCFSTGASLDTLSYKASILNASTMEPIKNTKLLLYNNFSDSSIINKSPDYMAICNETGNVTISNLGPKSFYAIALADENNNNKADDGEKLSIEKRIYITDGKNFLDTFLIFDYRHIKPQSLISLKSPENGIFVFSFDSNAGKLNIKPYGKFIQKPFDFEIRSQDKKQIVYYSSAFLFSDSSKFEINDSAGFNTVVSCINSKSKSLSVSTNIIQANYIPGDSFEIVSSVPISSVNSSKIKLLEDSFPVQEINFTQHTNKINLSYKFKPGSSYILMCDSGAFFDFRMFPSPSYQYAFIAASEESTSSIGFNISGLKDCQVILQLLNAPTGAIYRQKIINKNLNVSFGFITPGKYKLRIIEDINNNSAWDSGDFFLKQKPERVFVHPDEFIVKQNLEIDKIEIFLPF